MTHCVTATMISTRPSFPESVCCI